MSGDPFDIPKDFEIAAISVHDAAISVDDEDAALPAMRLMPQDDLTVAMERLYAAPDQTIRITLTSEDER